MLFSVGDFRGFRKAGRPGHTLDCSHMLESGHTLDRGDTFERSSGQEVFDNFGSFNAGQSLVQTLELDAEAFMVDS
jgi:hypothetical protein